MIRIEKNMADKESETDRWISHFRSMAKGTGDNEQKKFTSSNRNQIQHYYQQESIQQSLTSSLPAKHPSGVIK